jgi:hypothetical protein
LRRSQNLTQVSPEPAVTSRFVEGRKAAAVTLTELWRCVRGFEESGVWAPCVARDGGSARMNE